MRASTEPAEATSAQLLAVIESIDEGLVISDRHGHVVTVNRAAQRFLGDDWVPGARHHVSEFPRVVELATLDGRVLTLPERPMARVLRGETFSGFELHLRQIATGKEMVVSFAGAPVLDEIGEVDLAVVTGRDVTAQSRAEQLLVDDARRKDEFLALLGHELRNPLAPILAGSQVLLRAELGERERRMAEMIQRQAKHLVRLVDDLLEMSRITQGQLSLQRQRLDLAAIARETVDDHRPEIEAAGLTLRVEIPAAGITVEGDPTRLVQVIANLLANARKFTPAGGRVEVRLSRTDDGLARLTVTDTGIGIEPSELPKVFEPMRRAPQSQETSSGLGLGLALSRLLVALHGGRIAGSSPGRGKGATFELELPLAQ